MIRTIHSHVKRHYHLRYHGIYKHAKQLFVFDMFLLLTAIVLFGVSLFLFFWKPGLQGQIELSMSLGEGRIKSGEMVDLSVDFTNHSKYTLQSVALALRLPHGFEVDRLRSPESYFSKQNTITIPDLLPGASSHADVYGKLWTEYGRDEQAIASLSYIPSNSKTREQKLGTIIINLPESVLSGEIISATSSFSGMSAPYTIKLQNLADYQLNNIAFEKNWRDLNTDPFSSQKYSFTTKEVKEFSGKLVTPASPGKFALTLTPLIKVNNYTLRQKPAVTNVNIVYPDLLASARFVNPPAYGEPAKILPVEISWRNNSAYKLDKTKLLLSFTNPAVIDLKATASDNNLKLEGNQLFIDGTKRTTLASAEPGVGETFTVNLHLASHFTPSQSDDPNLVITPIIEAGLSLVPTQRFSKVGTSASLQLSTDIILSSAARYYTDEGDQLGRGPLPPKIGQTTKYWILTQIYNSTNKVRDAAFSARLSPGVKFTGKQSVTLGPTLKYDPASNKVTWNYVEMPQNSVTGLYFEVEVTPTADQVGKNIDLVDSLNFTATDDVVGKQFSINRPLITNILPATDNGAGRGSTVR